jgi:hypothetical protein
MVVATHLARVEGVERVAEIQHHEVRGVDDVVDGARAHAVQQRAHPQGRRRDGHAGQGHGGVARAGRRRLDAQAERPVAGVGDVEVQRQQRAAENRRDLARDAAVAPEVGAVGQALVVDLEEHVVECNDRDQRRSHSERGVQHHDAGVLVAQTQLALAADHALRQHAAQGPLSDLDVADGGAGQRHGDLLARRHVGRAADDRPRRTIAHVHNTCG